MQNTPKPILVSKKEAAILLSISLRTLDSLIARRCLPVRNVGKRVLIPYSALESFAKSNHETGRSKEAKPEVCAGV